MPEPSQHHTHLLGTGHRWPSHPSCIDPVHTPPPCRSMTPRGTKTQPGTSHCTRPTQGRPQKCPGHTGYIEQTPRGCTTLGHTRWSCCWWSPRDTRTPLSRGPCTRPRSAQASCRTVRGDTANPWLPSCPCRSSCPGRRRTHRCKRRWHWPAKELARRCPRGTPCMQRRTGRRRGRGSR